VTDVEKLKEIVAKCQGSEGNKVYLFYKTNDGETRYGFKCYASLQGYVVNNEKSMEYDFDSFVDDLQTVIAPGEAIIMMEIGYAELKFITGTAFIITREKTESLDLTHLALEKAAEVLGNPDYQTTMEY